MFSPCSLETCGMLVPGGSFLGNREASQMRFHVGPFFFERWGSPNFFEFWCFEIIGECWVLSSYLDKAQKKKDMLPKLASMGKMVWLHQFQPSDQRPVPISPANRAVVAQYTRVSGWFTASVLGNLFGLLNRKFGLCSKPSFQEPLEGILCKDA